MSLKKYWAKRDFKRTAEPKGKVLKTKEHRFVVQEHRTLDGRLHYDFRLEIEGVLKSWAVPKGPPEKAGEKRLAVQVEDHPLEYQVFHGVIPEGQYGAGKVEIWDVGKLKIKEKTANSIRFELFGKRLKGSFSLFQPPTFEKKNWLLFKNN